MQPARCSYSGMCWLTILLSLFVHILGKQGSWLTLTQTQDGYALLQDDSSDSCVCNKQLSVKSDTHTHTHPFNGPLSGTTRLSRYQKGKPIWILLKQETVSGSGICWAICKSAPCSRQITMPAPHHSVFYKPDALPAAQPTVSKH